MEIPPHCLPKATPKKPTPSSGPVSTRTRKTDLPTTCSSDTLGSHPSCSHRPSQVKTPRRRIPTPEKPPHPRSPKTKKLRSGCNGKSSSGKKAPSISPRNQPSMLSRWTRSAPPPKLMPQLRKMTELAIRAFRLLHPLLFSPTLSTAQAPFRTFGIPLDSSMRRSRLNLELCAVAAM